MTILLIIIGIIGFVLILAIIDIAREFPNFHLGEDLTDEDDETNKPKKKKNGKTN